MLSELGFIGTIGEDDEVPLEPESDSGDEEEEVGAVRARASSIASFPRHRLHLLTLAPGPVHVALPGSVTEASAHLRVMETRRRGRTAVLLLGCPATSQH